MASSRRERSGPSRAGRRPDDVCPGSGIAARGFTLIELMVVILLISLLLGFAIPRMGSGLPLDTTDRVARWLMANVPALKNKAREKQQIYELVVDIDNNRLWVRAAADHSEGPSSRLRDSLRLPPGMDLLDVVRPGRSPQSAGLAVIRFYPRGHSDKAVIHFRGRGRHLAAFLIEPFLPGVEQYAQYQTL
mgnify:CR=1 FL=1